MKCFANFSISYWRGVGILLGLPGVIRDSIEPCDGSRADEVLGAISLMLGFTVICALVGRVLARRGGSILIYSAP
jgi:hypothetical protein